jgi:hypothetical protein
MDKEYAISFVGPNGLDEVNSGEKTLTGAKKIGRRYSKGGAKEVTIKLYEEGDLRHQWDYKEGTWYQYE